MNKTLCIAVVGPTASGKSELAVKFAKQFNGEIISADSRQIYKGLDIGSGKVEGKWKNRSRLSGREFFSKTRQKFSETPGADPGPAKVYVYKGIPHYLIDEASPKVQYSVAKFQKKAQQIIAGIQKRGKVPIICGGTGHWIDAVVYNTSLPEVKPDKKLRIKLAKLSTAKLFAKLQKLDPTRSKNIDQHNPRRLIRALEIVISTGKPVPKVKLREQYRMIWIGINPDQKLLNKKITKRLDDWIKNGFINEVKKLRKHGLSWKRLESFGLEYKYSAQFLQKKISRDQTYNQSLISLKQYAKRQLTWWKRNQSINWFADSKLALAWITQRLRKELNN